MERQTLGVCTFEVGGSDIGGLDDVNDKVRPNIQIPNMQRTSNVQIPDVQNPKQYPKPFIALIVIVIHFILAFLAILYDITTLQSYTVKVFSDVGV